MGLPAPMQNTSCPVYRAVEESVEHFLLTCPGYTYKRWMFKNEATKLSKTLKMETILGNLSLTILLANFIDTMHRFKHIPSQQCPE